ncbi:lytic polysaccharide mono-oxygenase, cellulose-degrading domain-containing protein [Sarocladium implicatum]|nr:lytic polysaccharide mono-oxygenase, cellulose-degrading domain-containing protein [Sarocladium implicatum]
MFLKCLGIATVFVQLAWGHAVITSPTPRGSGDAQVASCGAAVTKKLKSDKAGPLENSLAVADSDYDCNLFLCRGYQFEDNASRFLSLAGGDVVDIHVDIIAGHRPGYANVSIVDTGKNEAIGEPLKVWENWLGGDASTRDEADFNVTVPEDLPESCAEPGNCVIQWYWYATSNKQTYISCLDFELV